MSLELFEEELKKIFAKHNIPTSSQLYTDVWNECQEWYEGVVSVKDMVIKGVERRAVQAEKKVEHLAVELTKLGCKEVVE